VRIAARRILFSAIIASALVIGGEAAAPSSMASEINSRPVTPVSHAERIATVTFNSRLNTLTSGDLATSQSETSVAACDPLNPAAKYCFGQTVMAVYNDNYKGGHGYEGVGYSVAFDGGNRWTDFGGLPKYHDSTGYGINIGDPEVTTSKSGAFYVSEMAQTHGGNIFVGMSTCKYTSSTGFKCGMPVTVTTATAPCVPFFHPQDKGSAYDKPAIAYDAAHNRIYVSWAHVTYDNTVACNITGVVPQFAYYNLGTGSWSPVYEVPTSSTGAANGTAPVVNGGKLYLFYENSTANSIQYVKFANGSMSAIKTVHSVTATGTLDTQAWDTGHEARSNEYPSAAVDSQGNIDVTWDGSPGPNGVSVVYIATLPASGGPPHIQKLPDYTDNSGQLLIQWQPSIAYAGGSNGLAVTYFQTVQAPDLSYHINRFQATATASATPSFGNIQSISDTSWTPPPNGNDNGAGNEGDYSGSASTPSASVVWSYWGDSRTSWWDGSKSNPTTDPSGQPQQDIYGTYTPVP
jgi:hypothetical protein